MNRADNAHECSIGTILRAGGSNCAELPIKNGKIDGNRISFVVSLDFGGTMFDLNYTGVVSKDSVEMSSDFMGMPFMFTLKKSQ